ncbi:hypothetical protein [Tistrella mobilis]|uniref:hypothetical protein n=1 Tax=Tistrella mobilis TaxID=171437 RepID=UPI003556E34E
MNDKAPETIEQRMTRILKRVIIGLGIAILVVGAGLGVLIYQRATSNKDQKPAGVPVATAPATQPAAPGQIAGDFRTANPPAAPARPLRPAGSDGPALMPDEKVVTLAAAGEDVMMVAEGADGAQVLVVIDRASGLLIRRIPLNAAAAAAEAK